MHTIAPPRLPWSGRPGSSSLGGHGTPEHREWQSTSCEPLYYQTLELDLRIFGGVWATVKHCLLGVDSEPPLPQGLTEESKFEG